LQGLFEAGDTDSSRFDVSNRSDGSKEYGVIIRTANADEIRIAGVVVESVMGDIDRVEKDPGPSFSSIHPE